jgi:thioredoxin reductase (NADPH)
MLDNNKIHDVIVIGGGPAGLTAGMYAARAGFSVLLLRGASSVSQITATHLIENYPGLPEGISGFDLVERFALQARQVGVKIADLDATAINRLTAPASWEVVTAAGSHLALALIIATGATWRRLGVPNEEKFIGRGVSFCATCDGPFFRNRDVAVVGGGDTAIQEALFLTHFARRVTVIHRRSRLRATAILRDRAQNNAKIDFKWDSIVTAIKGSQGVEKIEVKNVKTGILSEIDAQGLFVFVGLVPETGLVRNLVELNESGYILVDAEMRTRTEGIFAAGDCILKSFRQVVTACGDGAKAAYAAQHYLEALKGQTY